MEKGCRNLTVCFFMLFLNIFCAGYGWSEGVSPPNTRNINGPIHVSAENKGWVTHILPTGRIVSPVGLVNGAPNFVTEVVPVGNHVAALANGATRAQTITLYDQKTLERVAEIVAYKKDAKKAAPRPNDITDLHGEIIAHQSFFQGMVAGADQTIYAAGGESGDVAAFALRGGKPALLRRYHLTWQPFPKDQYPYEYQGHHINQPRLFYPDAVAVGPHGNYLYVTGMLSNSLARVNIQSGQTDYLNVGPYPYAVTFADGGQKLVISLWGGNAVAVVDPASMKLLGTVRVGPPPGPDSTDAGVHPTALAAVPHSPDVFVALANVDRIAEVDTIKLSVKRLLNDSPYPDAPPGSYPDGLTIVDGKLFVANAGNNDVAVYNALTGKGLGLIPTGWYPTAITHAGNALYVVGAKGLGSGPNVDHQWVGDMMDGLIQKIDLNDLSTHLPAWTQQSLRNEGFTDTQRHARHAEDVKSAAFLRKHIHYVVFILRENKTFDEDLGDYKPAGKWADPHFDLYGPKELPNLYRVWAPHNVLFANFMADGEVTAQGHQWVDGASDSDVVQRLWPEYYSNRGLLWNAGPGGTASLNPKAPGSHDPYQYNTKTLGDFTNPWISYPSRLYLFNDLLMHHVSFEDFGEDMTRRRDGVLPAAMLAHVDHTYPGWDRMLLDKTRVAAAIHWLKAHPGKAFPHFIYIWIPDDHTAGLAPCYYSPDYYVAQNDHATAIFLHYLSTTPEWKHMAVFLTEDDAQSGADHINAHRTFALAMGPWVKSGYLDTAPYSQVNIVKTVEAILGLPPMSQWDANAAVFSGIWRKHPRPDPMPVLPIQIPVQFNAGKCSQRTLLRREAGITGNILTPAWLKAHTDPHGRDYVPSAAVSYTPTTLLKVPGPEQLKQEWIASKGLKSYDHFMAYLRHYAQKNGATVASYEANEGKLH